MYLLLNTSYKCIMKKFLFKRLLFILLGVVAYILTKYAQNHQDWAEQYSRSVYPFLSNIVGFLPSFVKFSVTEIGRAHV